MKKIFIFSLLFLLTTVGFTQKILFDNTKSEQAGNADWIPDADAPIPFPAQSGITGNSFPTPTGDVDTYWSGALSMWGIEMAKRGYTIETLPSSGSITYGDAGNTQDLSNYDIFVACEPNNPFTAAEKTAILTFVQNGGGLFMIADHNIADRDGDGWSADEVWNDLMAGDPFGMQFNTASDITETISTNIANLPGDPLLHGVAGDVDGVEFHGGATLDINTTNNPSVIAVAYETGAANPGTAGVMCAYATYGSGRVVGLGDSSAAEDDTPNGGTTYPGWIQPIGSTYGAIFDMDNGRLITNATIWLLGTAGPALSATPSSITGLDYVTGAGPSAEQTFDVSGSLLDGSQVTVTAPTNFEVSLTSGGPFSASVTIPYTAPTLSATTVYVRLISGLAVNSYSGNVSLVDNGTASTINVAVSGNVTSGAAGCASDLIISQVNENGADKYVEIANFTGSSVSLIDYDLVVYANGATAPTSTIDLTDAASIADGDVWVLANANVSITADQVSGSFAPNGDDVIALRKTSTNIDVFGTIGNSTAWYADQQYIRNSNITAPTTTYASGDWIITAYGGGDPGTLGAHTMDCGAIPTLSVTPSTLTGYSYIFGSGPSASQNFSLSGTDLDGTQVTVTAPTNYEVSTDNITFTPSVVIAYTAPTLGATTIYVRLKAGLAVGLYNGELVTCSDDGTASNVTVSNDGEVLQPTLSVTPATLTGYSYIVGSGPSASQNFSLSGANLDGTQVTVTAPTNYEVSTDNTTFTPSVVVSYTAPTLNATTIYVRLKAGLAVGLYNGELVTCSDNGTASNVTVSNDGEVTALPAVTLADNGTQVAAANVSQNTAKHNLHTFKLTVANNTTTLSQVDFTSAGTYIATDITKFQLWYHTVNDLAAATQIGADILLTLGVGTHSFTGLSQALAVGDAFFWITTDIDVAATVGNTINVNAVATTDLTFTSGTKSGSTTAGGAQTIIAFVGPCGTETFANLTAGSSSYLSRSWTGDDGSTWSATDSRTDQTIGSGTAITLRTGYVTSGTIAGGVGDITITTDLPFSDPDGNLDVLVNGSLVGTVPYTTTPTTTTISGVNVTGNVIIRMESANSARITIDNVTWTCGGAGNDADSYVDGKILASQPNPGTIASTIDTDPEAINVFEFDIFDAGTADGLPTDVTQITIVPGTNNTADWSVVLQNAKISLDGGTSFVTTGAPVITAGSIVIPITAGNLIVADGGSATVSLFTYLNTTGITDNQILEFMVDGTAHGFTADAGGSTFASTFTVGTSSPVSNQITITVTATGLSFTQQPTNTVVNVAMSPNPTVSAVDINGNVDVDYNTAISVTSTGSLTGSPVAGTWASGVATFSSLVHTVIQTGRTLTASSGAFSTLSNLFDITAVPLNCASDLIISEYVEGTDNYIEIFNDTGADVDLSDYRLRRYPNGATTPLEDVALSGILLAGDVIVYGNSGATTYGGTFTVNAACIFNGDDAMALYKVSLAANIDVVGIIGSTTEPGASVTLVRKAAVFSGTTTYDVTEWDSYAVDDVSFLGSHTMVCTCEEPTVHASALTFSTITATSMTLNWTSGNGISRIVVAKEALNVDWVPTDLNTYTANSSFGSGTQLGVGNYVVYNGSGSSFTVTNLTPGTTYYFEIFEYGCQPGNEDYLTSGTPEAGLETTLPNDVTNFQVDCTTLTTANLSWTLPTGNYDGIIIAVLPAATPDNPTCDGITLTSPNTDFSLASVYCGNASGAVYVYNNVGTSVSITGLTAGTSYHFKAFTYKNSSWSAGSEIIQTAEVSNVADLTSTCGNGESLIAWTNPSAACIDEVIITVNTVSVTGVPAGTYTANSLDYTDVLNPTLSDGSVVVYNGSVSPQIVTGLTNGITYFFKVFVRSGTDWSSGVEVSCTATTATFFDYGDLAIVGINTHYIDYDGTLSDDEIQFVCFKDITTETAIDFTDNGYERLYAGKWADSEGTIRLTRTGPDVPAGTVITVRGRNAAANWSVFIGSGTPFGTLTNDDANWTITDGGAGNNVFDLNVNDQIWMMQGGSWINPTGAHNADYTGKVLYGWTAIGWEPAPGYDDTKGSTIFPSSACSVTNLVGVLNEDKVRYDSLTTATTQRDWISRFNDEQKWTGYLDSTSYQNGGTLPDVITITGTGTSTIAKWTGETSTDWDDCTNWLNLKVPSAGTNVEFVSDDCFNDIVILPGQTVACNDLNISGTALTHSIRLEGDATAILEVHGDVIIGGPAGVLDCDDGTTAADGILKVYGDWFENTSGGFLPGNSTVEFNGAVAQSINTVDVQADFYNLTINNSSAGGVSLSDAGISTGTLSLTAGILDLNALNFIVSGPFTGTNGVFRGNSLSDLIVNGTGTITYDFSFAVPQELNLFNMNRTGETAALATNLTMVDLQIDAGAVQMNAGKYFTVTGILTNTPGTPGLVLKSDATGTASLIQNNENIQATCERYVPASVWSYVFSPLSLVPTSLFNTGNPNFYYYNEAPADYWDAVTIYGTTGWTPEGTANLSINKGYISYDNTFNIYNMTGGTLYYDAINNNKVFTLSCTDNGTGSVGLNGVTAAWEDFEGWNLIGNPYTAAVDWNQFALANTENVVYYYDGAAANYKYFGGGTLYNQGITVNGGSQFIPANQAFVVKAIVNNGTVIIPDAARTHNAQAFWKKTKETASDILRLEVVKDGFKDETVIRYVNDATDEHDALFDAYKLFSLDKSKPMIYSRNESNSHYYALNTLSKITSHKVVPLGLYIGESDEYTFNFTENTFVNMHIWLEDRLLSTNTNLLNKSKYIFSQAAETNHDRFYVHFGLNTKPIVNIEVPDQETVVNEYYTFELPENTFIDNDFEDVLTITVSLASGEELPAWLTYDQDLKQFTGIPENIQSLDIRLTATDIFGAEVSDIFNLNVKSTSSVSDIFENQILIYPNPSNGKFTVQQNSNSEFDIKVKDETGRTIFVSDNNIGTTELDLSSFAKGIYFVEIKSNKNIVNKKLILE
ncbi:MAG: lamin tail domain-containing protein [Bacteroidales bacterium]|nr:lamin tail domain-containing protein [Bacteroidales bacterium]